MTAGGATALAQRAGDDAWADDRRPGCGGYPGEYPGGAPCRARPPAPAPERHGNRKPRKAKPREHRPATVQLRQGLSGAVRVPRSGRLAVGEAACPQEAICPSVVAMLGTRGGAGASRRPVLTRYGKRVLRLSGGERRPLRVPLRRSALRRLRDGGRLAARLVISRASAPPLIRDLTLVR
ncbi:MAG TPA: hypothetical protein VD931_04105 [Baekduia sp.]|nr:hypothetical protein [Baekduia sp.]